MQLEDAGPTGKQKRAARAADLIQSFFERVAAERYKPPWSPSTPTPSRSSGHGRPGGDPQHPDRTPMRHAFNPGETNLFAGLEEAAKIAKPWATGTAVLMVVTDGDTVPATGMPKMPASVGANVVLVGVGSPTVPKSIGAHMSRQDASTLRQVATRLNGAYHDGNDKHLATELVSRIDERAAPKDQSKMTEREYALWAVAVGTATLGFVPFALTLLGTGWAPGRHPRVARAGFGAAAGRWRVRTRPG
jgi:Ca-activated chloride channel family protein